MKKGWQRKPIGELCEVIAGQSPEGKFYNSEGKGMPFYQGKKDFGERYIEEPRTWTTQVTKIAQEGDILMSVRAPVGPVNIATDEICIGRGLAAIRTSPVLDRDFLYYQILHLQPEIAGKEGAVFASINKADIEAIPIAVTSLPEQKRIVGILDEAFESVATAKANAEKNLQNARAFFESHLHSVLSQRGEGWVDRKLGDVCQTGAGGTPLKSKKEYYEGGNIPWLMSGEVSQGEVVAATKFITNKGLAKSAAKLFPKDTVLVAMYGATAGQVGILRFEAATNQAVCGIFPNDQFVPEFIFYVLLSRKQELIDQATGNAQPNISQIKIRNTTIPVCPLGDQRRLVALLDSLSNGCEQLEVLYQRKVEELGALEKSLLHHAFTGQF